MNPDFWPSGRPEELQLNQVVMDAKDQSEPSKGRRRRRRGPAPAFVSGTSTEFLGRKPLPRAVQERPLVFVLGPRGVGKTRVSQRFLGGSAALISAWDTLEQTQHCLLQGEWPSTLLTRTQLIIESPCFLERRPAFRDALARLLQARVRGGRRTVVIEALDGISVQQALLQVVPPTQRATVLLRFPVGRGRQRFAARVCDELELSRAHARAVRDLDPWTYEQVYTTLRAIKASQPS